MQQLFLLQEIKFILKDGAIVITLTTVAAQLLTFENPISHHVKNNIYIYKKSPLPKVFSSDVSTNKIITWNCIYIQLMPC